MKTCNECGKAIDYRHDDQCAVRHPIEDYDLTQPVSSTTGALGQSPEDFERMRVAALPKVDPMAVAVAGEVRAVVQAVISEATQGLRKSMASLQEDVQAAASLMHMMDVPMEAIANSHERASSSFETLRRDILGGGLDKLEQVLDTSGLADASSKAEKRMEALALRIEKAIKDALSENSKAMVQVLHLLERLHSREMNKTKKRARKVPA